ncbi:hypothetical protein TNCV_3115351 [Trichonephila clavipes]|nr:hypothetical protein TNCV_3115351 [Trichonephila clavipes]
MFQRSRPPIERYLTGCYQPIQEFFPPTLDASEAVTLTTPPFHLLSTNQENLSHKGPSTFRTHLLSRWGMEKRFGFHFPVTFSF